MTFTFYFRHFSSSAQTVQHACIAFAIRKVNEEISIYKRFFNYKKEKNTVENVVGLSTSVRKRQPLVSSAALPPPLLGLFWYLVHPPPPPPRGPCRTGTRAEAPQLGLFTPPPVQG